MSKAGQITGPMYLSPYVVVLKHGIKKLPEFIFIHLC